MATPETTDTETDVAEDATMEDETEMEGLSARQIAMYHAIDAVEDLLGDFDQDAGPDGAHYSPESPWAAQGMKCANCVAYMGVARACHWVEGDIAPEGICKLWIIPENLMTEAPRA